VSDIFDIEVKDLTKLFRDFWCRPKTKAVDRFDMSVRRGEVFGLLGPNGSGKSTVLKILLGLLRPTSGSVAVLDHSPGNVSAKKLIGYLPEESLLYQHLTARETLRFYGGLFSLARSAIHTRTEQLLAMVGLTDAANKPVGEFSKGMARRLGLAQALINDPQLLLLDEPTAGLDPMGCHQVKDLLRALASRGKTILLCSHLLADVEDVCDRVTILHNGQAIAGGTIGDLLEAEDHIRFSLPSASPEKLDEIRATIRRVTGADPQEDHPPISLETFFVRVVHEAREAQTSSEMNAHGEGLADFLKQGVNS